MSLAVHRSHRPRVALESPCRPTPRAAVSDEVVALVHAAVRRHVDDSLRNNRGIYHTWNYVADIDHASIDRPLATAWARLPKAEQERVVDRARRSLTAGGYDVRHLHVGVDHARSDVLRASVVLKQPY